jgi:hypothetical protein
MLGMRVREAAAHYVDLLTRKHFSSTSEILEQAMDREGLELNGHPICAVLSPFFIEESGYRSSCRGAGLVQRALQHFVDRMLADRSFACAAGIPEYLEPILDIDRRNGEPTMIARFDGFVDRSGTLKFLEYNTEPGYIVQPDDLDRIFASMPIAAEFAERFPYRTESAVTQLLGALSAERRRRQQKGAPSIGVVRTTADIGAETNHRWLGQAMARGCTLYVANYEEFTFEGGRLRVEGHPIDVVLFDLETLVVAPPAAKPILEALSHGAVRSLYGVSRGVLSGAKVLFELLTDPSHWEGLDKDVVEALALHVPWTRRLRDTRTTFRGNEIDLLPYVEQHREDFVIKPSAAAGGAGVLLGCEATEDAWRQRLKDSRKRPSVVQERVATAVAELPIHRGDELAFERLTFDVNPYLVGDRPAGVFVRLAKGAITNFAMGASLTARWFLR